MFRTSLLAAAFTIGCLSAASAATIDFRGTLSGKTEVPPTTSNASGDVLATLDTGSKKLTYTITYIGLSGRRRRHTSMGRRRQGPTPA